MQKSVKTFDNTRSNGGLRSKYSRSEIGRHGEEARMVQMNRMPWLGLATLVVAWCGMFPGCASTNKDALVAPHDPADYLRRLRFHSRVRAASEYGLEGSSA